MPTSNDWQRSTTEAPSTPPSSPPRSPPCSQPNPPKSRAGRRDVSIGPETIATMRRHLLATGRPPAGSLVFSDSGGPLNATGVVRSTWKRVIASVRLTSETGALTSLPGPAPTFHATRHTWCVSMLRAGVRPEAIAKLGGWSDVGMIHRRYGRHALPDELASAGEALDHYRASVRGA
jgi:integrase